MFILNNTNDRLADILTKLYNYVLAKTKDKRQFNAPLVFAVKPICNNDNLKDYSIIHEKYSDTPVFKDGYFSIPVYIVRGFDIDLIDYEYGGDMLNEIIYGENSENMNFGLVDLAIKRRATVIRTLKHILTIELENQYGTKVLKNTVLKPTFKGLQVIFKDENTVDTILQNPTPLYNIIFKLTHVFSIKRIDYIAGNMYMLTYADDIITEIFKYINLFKRQLSFYELSDKIQLDVLYNLIDPKFKVFDQTVFNKIVESSKELDKDILQRFTQIEVNKNLTLYYPSTYVDVHSVWDNFERKHYISISTCLGTVELSYNSKYICKPSLCKESNEDKIFSDIKPY